MTYPWDPADDPRNPAFAPAPIYGEREGFLVCSDCGTEMCAAQQYYEYDPVLEQPIVESITYQHELPEDKHGFVACPKCGQEGYPSEFWRAD